MIDRINATRKFEIAGRSTLPKEFQCCRVGTPADRKIELLVPGSGQRIAVTVGEGTINLT